MMLYKYADWTNKYTKENLKTCKLGFNTPENFNDPFDTFPCYSIDNRDSFNFNLTKEILYQFFNNESYTKNLDIECFSNEDIFTLQSNIDKSYMYNSRYGITCFSKTANNILMWSHYANKHRGICLGFDIPEECIDFFDEEKLSSTLQGKLFEINYTDKRYCWNILEQDQENILALLSSKHTDWAYEQECRIFLRCNNLYTFPTGLKYKLKYLKEIILGANITLKDYIDFYNIKKEKFPDLTIKISNLSKEQYKLEISSLSEEEQINLFNNYNFLKNNIPDNIFKNLSKIKPKKIKKEWLSALNNFPIYAIKTYWSKFLLEQELETSISPRTYLPNNDSNNIIKSLLFINTMQENICCKLKIISP